MKVTVVIESLGKEREVGVTVNGKGTRSGGDREDRPNNVVGE